LENENKDQPAAKPVPPPPSLWVRFVGKIESKLQERKAKKAAETPVDRAARITATATVWMAAFTAVLVAVGILTLYVLKTQLKEMHEGGIDTHNLAEAAGDAANAATDQADAAQQFSDTAEDINNRISDAVDQLQTAAQNTKTTINNAQNAFREEQRAWVGLGPFRVDHFDDKEPFVLILPWVNSGKTPAIQAETAVSYQFTTSRPTGPQEGHKYIFQKASAIAPQGVYATTVRNADVPPRFAAITDGTLWMVFAGKFRYHDVHSQTVHTTSFCLLYDRTTKQMVFCDSGNDMD
jgi:hypothetical protein